MEFAKLNCKENRSRSK